MRLIVSVFLLLFITVSSSYSAVMSTNVSKKISDFVSGIIPGDGYTETSVDLRENNSPDFSILAVREIDKNYY